MAENKMETSRSIVSGEIKTKGKLKQANRKLMEVLAYCEPHTDLMWAAAIVGIILDCDFRYSKEELKKLGLK